MMFEGAPDPEDARRRWNLLIERGLLPDEITGDLAEVTWIACAMAPYLAVLAARDPARLRAAAADPYLRREKPKEVMAEELAAELAGVTTEAELLAALRRHRAREFIRLGAKEYGLSTREEVGRELAALADCALDAAVRFHDADLERQHGEPLGEDGRAGFVVFGMGKLGGGELNFASDVDLIYLYSTDEGAAGSLSLHEYFEQLARGVTRALGEVTEDDHVFRVDLRLRPEGTRGPLVNSLPSAERYYESWGRPWERQAWLKARPCAGDVALGEEALRALEPFIYPRTIGPGVIRDVQDLNRKIKSELVSERGGPDAPAGGFDVKVGRGGIREIEFFVQALQLVHAGKRKDLRARSTRRALDRLLFAGLVAERERRQLADAYEFLRHTEHVLQLDSGRQTQKLPSDFEALTIVARRLGCADAGELMSVMGAHTRAVAEIFATLGGGAAPRPEIGVLLDPARAEAEIAAAFSQLGFRDAAAAVHELELLRKKPLSPFGPAATREGARVAPALLEELAASPDPDQALRFAVDLAGRAGVFTGIWRLLDENRPLLRLVASLFGTSSYLARTFVEHPELLDLLLLAGRGGSRDRADLHAALDELMDAIDDPEAAWNVLRQVKSEEVLRVGMADIAGELDEVSVCERLSDLADECVARTYALVREVLERRRGPMAPMVVLSLGKHGGGELGYAGDLDLVFVYDGGVDDHEAMTKLAQRLVNALGAHTEEGRLYEVDTRLRPSGQQGTLVSSFEGWRAYHESQARLWERQALIKARAVAGDAAFAARLEQAIADHVYGGPEVPPARIAEELLAMRGRIEKEIAAPSPGLYDIKAGRGGILDVEFATQFIQLVHGRGRPALRAHGTLEALDAAAREGVLPAPDRATLAQGYRFLRRLEHRMRIVHDRPIHALPADPLELDKLARRTGFPSASALERAVLTWTRDVRACYLKILRA
jgi:[glutamine synthetase] adenylyltransferase / [glutamine synthetase]-adenylyl-L-tyrosine phosphorylase